MTPQEIRELHLLQQQSFKELFKQQPDPDSAVKLVNINSAANTFFELLMEKIPELAAICRTPAAP